MNYLKTNIENFQIRFAEQEDTALIFGFIKELASYEHMLNEVTGTEEMLRDSLFVQKKAEVIIGELGGVPVGFALFFHNYSTFLCKPGIYLEDLYMKPAVRGQGLGKAMLSCLAKLAVERNCGRLEWWCLDWNQPSIRFYKQMGAEPMDEWTVYRVDKQKLKDLAVENN
jgi:GNAT superfamily N-acetyltransferase